MSFSVAVGYLYQRHEENVKPIQQVREKLKTTPSNKHVTQEEPDIVTPIALKQPEAPKEVEIVVASGNTLVNLLNYHAISDIAESYRVANAASKIYNFATLKVGQKVYLDLAHWNQSNSSQKSLAITTADKKVEVFCKNKDKNCDAKLGSIDIEAKQKLHEGLIKTNLFDAALDAGVPSQVIMNFIRLLSYELDFQMDVYSGSKFKVLYDYTQNSAGKKLGNGNILYAALFTKNNNIEIYGFTGKNGKIGYYHKNGKNLSRSLLKTPVNNGYVSSGYGMRRHPVLGYSRMHKGLDYAAKRGTPVLAAGKGVVQVMRYGKGYGRYIKVKHNKTYSTLYAHLDRYNKKLTRGAVVKQGEVIGYVGKTGMATGPHLHYEVHKNGTPINPAKVHITISEPSLTGKTLLAFKAQKSKIEKILNDEFYIAAK